MGRSRPPLAPPPRSASAPSPAASGAPVDGRLVELSELVETWLQLHDLRMSSISNPTSCHDRRRHAATSLAACSRAEMTAALLAQRSRLQGLLLRAELDAAVVMLCGAACHASLLELLQGCLCALASLKRIC